MGSGGGVWDTADTITKVRMNQKSILVDTGANIALATTYAGMLAFCTTTGGGFTAGILYRRDATNTAWGQLVDLDSTQTITGAKTFSGTTDFTGIPTLANSLLMKWKDSGGTARQVFTLFSDNHLYIDNDAAGNIVLRTDNGSGAGGNQVTRLQVNNGTIQGSTGITYYEPLSSGHVDAGIVNALHHDYGRRWYRFKDVDYLTTSGTGTPTFTKAGFATRLLTTTASNDTAVAYVSSSTGAGIIPLRRDRKFELWFYINIDSTITNYEFEVGAANTISTTVTQTTGHHCAVQYKSGTSANFIASNANGTTQTTTTSSTAVSGGAEYLIGIINNETNLKFYVNGTLIATQSTNLPGATTTLQPHMFVKTLTTVAKNLYVMEAYGWTDDQT